MPKNNDKILVPRNRDFSNLLFAQDVTEFAELVTAQPPTLPVNAYTNTIVQALEAAGYKFIAASMKQPKADKVRVFKDYLDKADLNDDVRYSMAMMQPEYETRYQFYKDMVSVWFRDGIGAYVCTLDQVVKFQTGIWRK